MTDAPERIIYEPDTGEVEEYGPGDERFLGDGCVIYLRADLVPSWQPIETAPRDGTEILGYREDLGTWIVRWDSDELSFTPGFKPTHWMPLPEPPDA